MLHCPLFFLNVSDNSFSLSGLSACCSLNNAAVYNTKWKATQHGCTHNVRRTLIHLDSVFAELHGYVKLEWLKCQCVCILEPERRNGGPLPDGL